MITFSGVSKRYLSESGGIFDFSAQIQDNEFVFLVGPSGAGKTTLLRLLLRELVPDEGEVLIEDQVISSNNFKDLPILRRSIGMIFQDCRVLPDKTVFENVALALEIASLPDAQIRSETMEALQQVGLAEKMSQYPTQLSAGELQRTTIARSIIGNRHIILADEPTGNLDPTTAWEIMKIFKSLEGSKTIIIATHNAEIVNTMKKRVISLKDGRMIKDKKLGTYEL